MGEGGGDIWVTGVCIILLLWYKIWGGSVKVREHRNGFDV